MFWQKKKHLSFTLDITPKGTYLVKCDMPKGFDHTLLSSLLIHIFAGNPKVIESVCACIDDLSRKNGWRDQGEEIIEAILEEEEKKNMGKYGRKPMIAPSEVLNTFRKNINPK